MTDQHRFSVTFSVYSKLKKRDARAYSTLFHRASTAAFVSYIIVNVKADLSDRRPLEEQGRGVTLRALVAREAMFTGHGRTPNTV
jgi:hypothetical protein